MVSKFLANHSLFKECIEALNVSLLPEDEADILSELLLQIVPITTWGKVDWEKITHKIEVGYNPQDIIPALKKLLGNNVDTQVYIEWDNNALPVIKTTLEDIVRAFDDVACVSFEKFIFNPFAGLITVGLI